jgi:alpha-tubulin suppressor-like RCC1 family protein
VKCWGANGFGQLGDGSDTQRLAPVQVSGLASGVQAIAAGGEHTCALTTGGGVKCWGANDYGQLGNNGTSAQHAPVDVSGLASGVVAISAGRFHTCAVTSGGGAKCWGANENGELGDGTQTERHVPVDVSGLASGVASIAAGQGHTCARTSGGGVKCWGSNGWGQVGDGSGSDRLTPVDVSGLTSGATSIGVGSDHSCAVATAGRVLCWGSNQYGQLGNDTNADSLAPVFVLASETVFENGFD